MTEPAPAPGADTPEAPQLMPLPVESIADALPHLRRPFAPGAVKWKVQSTWPKNGPAEGAIIVGYIDARLVSERLNKVVAGNWSEKPVRIGDRSDALLYELTVFEQTHVDVGVEQGSTTGMKLKAVHSDGLKRPAVRFGVGVSLYAMPEVRLLVTDHGNETSEGVPTIKRRNDGKAGYLYESHEAHLRKRYEDWLRGGGEEAFGSVLDHGDAPEGSVGDEVPADGDPATEPTAEPLTDARSDELRAEARKLRDEIREVDADSLPQQSFDNAMAQREHAHDRLEDFVGNLTELLADVRRFAELREQLAQHVDEGDLKKVIERAQRKASRRERVDVLEKALAEATGEQG